MIKRLLRWRGDESLETYARVNDDQWARWVGASIDAQVDSSISTRFTDMDFSPEIQQHFTDLALAMADA